MLIKTLAVSILLSTAALANAQVLGGGPQFSNAILFNQSWVNACPSGSTIFSNESAFEPTTAIDPCAPAPKCVNGTALADIWFYFFAEATTATIVVNPSGTFNIALQAFSGNACPGLTEIGCIDAGGNGATETLKLNGLIPNQMYYFRLFGSSNDIANRTETGTYDFCGSAQLGGGAVLAVEISNFSASKQNNLVQLTWSAVSTTSDTYFEIERSSNGNTFQSIGKVAGAGPVAQSTHYSFDDNNPLTTGVNYYRLKEISTNGSYKYSAVVSVKMDAKSQRSVTILSNPVTDKLNVRISSDAATSMQLKVINDLGQVIWRQSGTVVKGDNFITVTGAGLHDLRQGMYTLQVNISNETLNTKFISTK
jgi:hypothetical protein